MAKVIIMPRQGQSVEECIITKWAKKVGEKVAAGDILFSYETDKSAFDEVSDTNGVLLAALYDEGDVVPCLSPICIIGEEGEDISSLLAGIKETGKSTSEDKTTDTKKDTPAAAAATINEAPAQSTGNVSGGNIKISPRARLKAERTGADITSAIPTGYGGRIIERDIDRVLDEAARLGKVTAEIDISANITTPNTAAVTSSASVEQAPAVNMNLDTTDDYIDIPLSPTRRAIAASMHRSLTEAAQLTLHSSFDATEMLSLRAKFKEKSATLGLPDITFNDMVLFAVSRVILSHPDCNAHFIDNAIRRFKSVNLAVAVDTERGLLVPVIRGAEKMSLSEISVAVHSLAAEARSGRISPDALRGGSVTVTNLGSLGVESFTPVLNPPQTVIIGICAPVTRVREDGSVYPAVGVSLTFDHRALDGAPAARFLRDLCTAMENISLYLAK